MTTWVFLRGLTREARHWGDFVPRFRAARGAELAPALPLSPDLPGNGRLWREVSPLRVEAMMEECRAQLCRQGHAPPYRFLGLSLGGMVALAWATRHPEECAAAVLVNTSLRPWCPMHERLRPGALTQLPALTSNHGEARERAILELTSARPAAHASILPAWAAYARECPVTRRNALRQLIAAARFRCDVRPAVPLLILAGAGDRLVHPRCSETLAQAWSADFKLHPWAGHDLALDDGDWVAEVVREWLGA